jgi:hypothetical protein
MVQDLENKKVRVLFVSEGNVCRSVYAEAIFNSLIEEHGMQEFVECASKVCLQSLLLAYFMSGELLRGNVGTGSGGGVEFGERLSCMEGIEERLET